MAAEVSESQLSAAAGAPAWAADLMGALAGLMPAGPKRAARVMLPLNVSTYNVLSVKPAGGEDEPTMIEEAGGAAMRCDACYCCAFRGTVVCRSERHTPGAKPPGQGACMMIGEICVATP